MTKGWLKPAKLKEISGTPAATIIARQQQEKRRKKKHDDFISKYHENQGIKGVEPVTKQRKTTRDRTPVDGAPLLPKLKST